MLSEALRLIRTFHDLKQKQLAEQIGLSRSYISEIEKGHKIPTLDVIEKYSTRFINHVLFRAISRRRKNYGQVRSGAWCNSTEDN